MHLCCIKLQYFGWRQSCSLKKRIYCKVTWDPTF